MYGVVFIVFLTDVLESCFLLARFDVEDRRVGLFEEFVGGPSHVLQQRAVQDVVRARGLPGAMSISAS